MLSQYPVCYVFLYVGDLAKSRDYFEKQLHFRPIEKDADAAKYKAGRTMIGLNVASTYGIDLSKPRTSSLVVFHTGDIEAAQADLGKANVATGKIDRYGIGATLEIADPDKHGLMLYELSPEALTWPSAKKIREVVAPEDPARKPRQDGKGGPFRLGERPLVYIFQFVRDAAEAADFYQGKLGLKVLETDDSVGVVKYDAGGFILATHAEDHLGEPGDAPRVSAMSLVFLVPDIEPVFDDLNKRGVTFRGGISQSAIGRIVRFDDPNGHAYFLYEPSAEALNWPSGSELKSRMTKVK